ncbi:hypothetical protein OS493_003207 [Desmophyllum pertusum]|uniref:Uncharacterized protein n=1 Tax=Desmophyllum pertusum TaxID=174260 RepID=A0A9W9YGQ1_9CNID|nr:hypothetical protein OS493_003207 [Desmophyllum pertusum]
MSANVCKFANYGRNFSLHSNFVKSTCSAITTWMSKKEPTGFLEIWSNTESRFLYWARYDNADQACVFSDLPKRWKCGIVHLADYALEADSELKYKDFCHAVYILSRIQREAKELELDCVM